MENLSHVAVIPVLVGPLQVLLAILPGLLIAMGSLVLAMFKPSAVKKALSVAWRLKLPLILAAAVIVGGWFGVRALWPNRVNIGVTEAPTDEWNMFRGGPQRLGSIPSDPTPGEAALQWSFAPKDEAFYASPAVHGNRLYITSAEYGVFQDRGAIYCLDADSGERIWSYEPQGFRATFSSPSISKDGQFLVCGEGLHLTQDARVFCLDISDETLLANGAPRVQWSYRTKSHVESSPAVVDGKVFVGAGSDGYYAFSLEGNGEGEPELLWHTSPEETPDAESPPLVYAGKVYVGLGLRGDAVACLDVETGEELWRVQTPYPVFGPPSIQPGGEEQPDQVFVGMGVGDFVNDAEAFAEKEIAKLRDEGATSEEIEAARRKYQPAGEVWSIDANTGEVLWKQSLNRVVLGAVAVTGDQLFCASRGGTVYSLRPSDGEILRTFDVHEPVIASPAVNSSHIFISTSSGRLFCLDRDSLQPVWSMQFGEGGMAFSSPTVARGHVYVGSEKGGLFSLGRVAENVVGPVWSGYLGDTGHTAVWGNPSLPERGSKLSEYPDREALQAAQDAGDPLLITAPPALYDEMLYIPVSGGDEGFRLAALPEGEKREFARPAWSHSVGSTITMSAAVSPENVFLVDGAKGDDERQLHCLGRTSGTLRWQQPVASEASGAFVLAHDRLYINDVAGQLSCLGLDDGELLWKQEMGGDPFTPVQYGAMTFATVRDSSHLIALDRETGVVLWKTALENGIVGSPVIFEETIIAPTAQGIEARNMVDGSSIWEQVTAKPASALVITLSALAFTASDGAVIAMNPETGDILDRTEGASPPWPPLVLDNTLLYVADGQIMSKTIGGEESAQRWMTTSWLGELTTPLLVKDAWLYFGTSERGLVRAGKWR